MAPYHCLHSISTNAMCHSCCDSIVYTSFPSRLSTPTRHIIIGGILQTFYNNDWTKVHPANIFPISFPATAASPLLLSSCHVHVCLTGWY